MSPPLVSVDSEAEAERGGRPNRTDGWLRVANMHSVARSRLPLDILNAGQILSEFFLTDEVARPVIVIGG